MQDQLALAHTEDDLPRVSIDDQYESSFVPSDRVHRTDNASFARVNLPTTALLYY
jgi:hypothetical protein